MSLRHVGESAIRAINGTVLRESGRWRKECRIGRIAAARESLEDTKNINIDVEQYGGDTTSMVDDKRDDH